MDVQHLVAQADAAASIASVHAEDVDAKGRFPAEAIQAFRSSGLLGLLVPVAADGPGASLADVANVCRILGQACASSALIYAMHQIQVACLIAGAGEGAWQQTFLRRIAVEQLLLASVTSEVGIGGNIRSSLCSPEIDIDHRRVTLLKHSSAISYGEHADALLVTARRHADASASDQVLIVAEKHDVVLSETSRWDTLGMRGTDSKAFDVRLSVDAAQIVPVSFGELAQHTMLPTSHILWGAVWLGIAVEATEKARAFLRRQAQANPGVLPPGGIRFEKAASLVATMRTRLESATTEYARNPAKDLDALPLGFLAEVNALKVTMSELALDVVQQAMMICGIAGYKNGTPYSIGRHLRDLYSAPLMVNNDRIAANTATLLIAQRSPLLRGSIP
ncbi:acyl-CoA/acyl-ACP dehydrogenase [Lichenicola cladoniae]|uniref:Acyl-CoA/acyl-ACP dehydrogenase n=1 Tax=Lichenicola cladoniae TaxID=1484109 RepID=A0A6M8HVY9_9PROT|nr:acyl-CoA dehydrogenase family protein [Lichenicola cladoniae]NPD65151.1 acyl-CoA/acyl-ACP dehydrogenase [Acetobacteraceae bacterium]QKE92335.1 acyl-CoA/acyl-ACP dehydrogenase [Lichenicola cladoniae]